MSGLLIAASIAFRVWMFLDAMRRSAPVYWLVLIALPFGDVLYYFLVKAPDPAPEGGVGAPALEELRYRFEHAPSLSNRVALGAALYDAGEYPEALEHYCAACRQDSDYLRARYGLGLCQRAVHDYAGAIQSFQSILREERGYADWAVWVDLAETLARDGQDTKSMETLAGLVDANPRLDHVLMLAAARAETGQLDSARCLLEQGLEDHQRAPAHIQRAGAVAARGARQLLGQIVADSGSAAR